MSGVGVGVPSPRNPQERATTGPSGDAILREDGVGYILLESGDYLLKE